MIKKNTTNEIFRQVKFVEVKRIFLLVYTNEDAAAKRFKAKRYYLPKGIINNDVILANRNNVYNQAIDSDIKWYEEITKLTAGQCEDYTSRCLLDYDIKNLSKIIID